MCWLMAVNLVLMLGHLWHCGVDPFGVVWCVCWHWLCRCVFLQLTIILPCWDSFATETLKDRLPEALWELPAVKRAGLHMSLVWAGLLTLCTCVTLVSQRPRPEKGGNKRAGQCWRALAPIQQLDCGGVVMVFAVVVVLAGAAGLSGVQTVCAASSCMVCQPVLLAALHVFGVCLVSSETGLLHGPLAAVASSPGRLLPCLPPAAAHLLPPGAAVCCSPLR